MHNWHYVRLHCEKLLLKKKKKKLLPVYLVLGGETLLVTLCKFGKFLGVMKGPFI